VLLGGIARDGNPKIRNPNESILIDEHVRRFEIAVQDALRVGCRQAVAQLLGNVDDFLSRQAADPAYKSGKVFAMDELHRIEDFAITFADVENPADRGMRDLSGQANLVEDALSSFRIGRMDQLQGHRHLEDQIVGSPDLAHPAVAEARDRR
jgi:hypothetical protein